MDIGFEIILEKIDEDFEHAGSSCKF
jgi:hypothetical protein